MSCFSFSALEFHNFLCILEITENTSSCAIDYINKFRKKLGLSSYKHLRSNGKNKNFEEELLTKLIFGQYNFRVTFHSENEICTESDLYSKFVQIFSNELYYYCFDE